MIVKHICSVSINICSTISQIFKSARPGKFIAQIVFLSGLLLFKAIISNNNSQEDILLLVMATI